MKTGFYEIFCSLSAGEKALFNQYLSVFHAGSKVALRTFSFLQQASEKHLEWTEDSLFEQVFERTRVTPLDRQSIQNTLGDLKKWLMAFLTWEEIKGNYDHPDVQIWTIGALRRRGLFDAYAQQTTRLRKKIPPFNEQTMWDTVANLKFTHHDYFHVTDDEWSNDHSSIEEIVVNLDHFYGAAKLLYACEIISRKSVIGEQFATINLDDLLKFTAVLNADYAPVSLFRDVLLMTRDDDKTIFLALKRKLLQNPPKDKTEQNFLLMYLLNFSARAIQRDEQNFIEQAFDLYEHGIRQHLFIINGFFPIGSFSNIVNIACNLQKFEWVENFIEKWEPSLKPDQSSNMKFFFQAKVAFERGTHGEVLELLQNVTYSNLSYNLQARLLLIRSCYELKVNSKMIEANCQSTSVYIRRHKSLGENYRNGTLNFIKIFRLLISGKSKKVLEEALTTHTHVFCRPWLKNKINQL